MDSYTKGWFHGKKPKLLSDCADVIRDLNEERAI